VRRNEISRPEGDTQLLKIKETKAKRINSTYPTASTMAKL